MRKYAVFSSALFLSIIMAGAFGILHDQITATISPEYFTQFKFIQFKTAPALPFRLAVAIVGFYATWWTGIIIGPILGLVALLYPDYKTMRKYLYKSLAVVFLTTICFSAIGYLAGLFYYSQHIPDWYYLPATIVDKTNFITVGTIHNFSYLGGFTGLVIAIIYLQVRRKNLKYNQL